MVSATIGGYALKPFSEQSNIRHQDCPAERKSCAVVEQIVVQRYQLLQKTSEDCCLGEFVKV